MAPSSAPGRSEGGLGSSVLSEFEDGDFGDLQFSKIFFWFILTEPQKNEKGGGGVRFFVQNLDFLGNFYGRKEELFGKSRRNICIIFFRDAVRKQIVFFERYVQLHKIDWIGFD